MRIDVVGAGLVGSLTAKFFAQMGAQVAVFEKRPDSRKQIVDRGRSINLAISVRGLAALEKVGLKQNILSHATAMKGRYIHLADGTEQFQPYSLNPDNCIYSLSRMNLNQILMDQAEDSGHVQFHFESEIRHATDTRLRGDILIATDGSASELRNDLLSGNSDSQCQIDTLDYGYKEFLMPLDDLGRPQLSLNFLHIWPRGQLMFIALPNKDGTFTCTLFLPLESREAFGPSFECISTMQQMKDFFQKYFPQMRKLIPDCLEQFTQNPIGRMATVRCSPWTAAHGRPTLLLGDAAHAIVPFFGQGMNAGFEDLTLLTSQLSKPESFTAEGFETFWKNRKPDTDAIADLALENFIEMRDLCANPRFLLERKIEKILEQKFSDRYVSRYEMVSFSQIPYRNALAVGKKQASLLNELSQGIERADDLDLQKAQTLLSKF